MGDKAARESEGRAKTPQGVIGVVHLQALPGDPRYDGATLDAIESAAARDAEALATGGAQALIVENFGSVPFVKGDATQPLPPHAIAVMTRIALRCRSVSGLACGVNCLRNDARAALGIAVAAELDFIRVNVHCGAAVADQGVLEGRASETLRERRLLDAEHVAILADVHVKHARPLAHVPFEESVADTIDRGLADGVLVTGVATGAHVDPARLAEAAQIAGRRARVYVGSGFDPESVEELAPHADGAVVGTWLRHGDLAAPIDPIRVRELVEACVGRFRTDF